MKRTTIIDQLPLIARTNKTINDYGLKIHWMADKTRISSRHIGSFINQRLALTIPETERLTKFLDEFESRMNGFREIEI